jgi:hypothetical protein
LNKRGQALVKEDEKRIDQMMVLLVGNIANHPCSAGAVKVWNPSP